MTGNNTGNSSATTPSPTGTSYVIVETEPETPAPVSTIFPANATEVTVNASTTTGLPLPSAETLEKGAKKQAYPYVIRTLSQFLYYNTYGGVVDYLKVKYPSRPTDFSGSSLSDTDYRQYISDPVQKTYINGLVENIRDRSDLPQERVRIAVSMVQHIPYSASAGSRYPYEVLYYNTGRCDDKSILAAYLLSEMGYGTALLVYLPERHVALGLKCPKQYSTGGSGYCFVETSYPSIMTYSNGTYAGVSKPVSNPLVIPIADGQSFDQIGEEYTDAAGYQATLNSAVVNSTGIYMDSINYEIYGDLRQKYGLPDLGPVKMR